MAVKKKGDGGGCQFLSEEALVRRVEERCCLMCQLRTTSDHVANLTTVSDFESGDLMK